MPRNSPDSFGSRAILAVGRSRYNYHSLPKFAESFRADISRLPYSIKILLENLLRRVDGVTVKRDDIVALGHWHSRILPDCEIQFMPARVLLLNFTGVPAIADLAATRSASIRTASRST